MTPQVEEEVIELARRLVSPELSYGRALLKAMDMIEAAPAPPVEAAAEPVKTRWEKGHEIRVMRALGQNCETVEDVCANTGLPEDKVRATLRRLERYGWLLEEFGAYKAVDAHVVFALSRPSAKTWSGFEQWKERFNVDAA